jgi:hypothetical protein
VAKRCARPISLLPAFVSGLAVAVAVALALAVGLGLARLAWRLILPALHVSHRWSDVQAAWLNTASAIGDVRGAGTGLWLLRRRLLTPLLGP